VQEVRNHAIRVDAIVRTQDTINRDIADNRKALDDLKRCLMTFATGEDPEEAVPQLTAEHEQAIEVMSGSGAGA
jgi:hypothetical protein